MKFSKILLAGLAFATSFAAMPAQAELSETDVKTIVREYIEKNGDVLIESIATYEKNRQRQAAMESISKHTPVRGNPDAKVVMIEFSEYECPFCRRAQPTINEIYKRYKNRVQFAYKHMPLDFHPKAEPAALAAMAAKEQGKFWEYSEKIWERQEFLGEKLYVELAKELNLDMDKFNKDRKSDALKAQLVIDKLDGQKVGARGTPYFLINGVPLSGAQPLNAFVEAIERALNDAE